MTLVELLISMVLSLTVIAGIGSLFFQMQKSNKIQRALATMADESSYVQEVLQKEIRRTGGLKSRADVNGTETKIFLSHTNLLNSATPLGTGIDLANSEYIKGDATATTDDAFVIRYQLIDINDLTATSGSSSNSSSPCTQNVLLQSGENPELDPHVVNVFFYLDNGILKCSAQRHVQNIATSTDICKANCTTPNSTTDFSTANSAIELVGNISHLVIRYGVDSTNDGAADYYTDAATIPSANWINVISVISFVIRSADDYLINSINNYVIEGTTYTPTDHRIYKVFTTTVALRNQL